MENRISTDRRLRPTPIVSRYIFWGRRKGFRRQADRRRGGYVDRYHPGLLFFLILISGLNILDSSFTMMILDYGGREVNPIVEAVMNLWGDGFWIWKFAIVSASLVILCLHSKYRMAKTAIVSLSLLYSGVVSYQMILLSALH